MSAIAILDRRQALTEHTFVDLKVWELPAPVRGCTHLYKYRLALVVDDQCVLRYDNEVGKGDHKHADDNEYPYRFVSLDNLLTDFWADVTARLK